MLSQNATCASSVNVPGPETHCAWERGLCMGKIPEHKNVGRCLLRFCGEFLASLHVLPSCSSFFSLGYSYIVKVWAVLSLDVSSHLWVYILSHLQYGNVRNREGYDTVQQYLKHRPKRCFGFRWKALHHMKKINSIPGRTVIPIYQLTLTNDLHLNSLSV